MNFEEKTVQLNNTEKVILRWVPTDQIHWRKYESVYVESMLFQLKDCSPQELDLATPHKRDGIQQWFELEIKKKKEWIRLSRNGNSHQMYFMEAKSGDQIIGYAVWHWFQRRPTHVYQSSLHVLPEWLAKGIRTRMVYAIKDILLSAEYFLANARKTEKNHMHRFYLEQLKCKPCPVVPEEDLGKPESFTGYVGRLYDQ